MKVVRGKRLRVTRVDRCGMPLAGPKAQQVTKGFISINYSQEMKDAEDLEQTNADGEVCVSDRTPPEIKWVNIEAEFCDVDVELLSIMTGLPQVLDYRNRPGGFRINNTVPVDEGFALELWSGTAGDDCDEPEDDSILEATSPILEYGYWLAPAVVEGVIGDIEIGASVATFTVTGRAVSAPRWGRGPYQVVATDGQNTPGRLLSPIRRKEFIHVEKTTIAPPPVSDGAQALTLPTPYYEPAVEPSPPQVRVVSLPEGTTGGTFTLTFGGETTGPLAHDASAGDVESALAALGGLGSDKVAVSGPSGGAWTVTIDGGVSGSLSGDGSGLEPTGTVTVA